MKERYNTILLKSSEVAGQIPQVSDLMPGELAINVADGKLYALKLTDGQYEVIELAGPVTGGGSGSGTSPSIQNLVWSLVSGDSNIERYPAYGYYDYSHSMFIIRPDELESDPMIIHGLEVEVAGYTAGYTFSNQTIKMAHTTDLEFGDNVKVDLTNINGVTDLTTVKGSFDWTINGSGYQTFDFDTNFEWNGQDSILVIHENHDGSWGSGFGWAECHFDNTYYSSWFAYQDSSYPSGYGTKDQSYRPNFKLKY
jgi:hypothetical protein